ncbi:MAG: hypothetical protein RLZZ139_3598 [Cyanobacteriota bacterium]|jgi:hypothetical protein
MNCPYDYILLNDLLLILPFYARISGERLDDRLLIKDVYNCESDRHNFKTRNIAEPSVILTQAHRSIIRHQLELHRFRDRLPSLAKHH